MSAINVDQSSSNIKEDEEGRGGGEAITTATMTFTGREGSGRHGRTWMSRMSVEPIITMSLFSMSLQSVVQQNLLQDFICMSFFGGTKANCSDYVRAFNSTPHVIAGIQAHAADFTLYSVSIGLPATLILVMLMGQWSDRRGRRRPIILIPLCGGLLSALSFVLLVRLGGQQPLYILLAGIPAGVTGAQAMIIMGCYSYLSGTTTKQERTVRVALADGALSIGIPFGTMVGSRLYTAWGYEAVFIAQAIAYGLTILYTMLRVKDIREGYEVVEDQDLSNLSPAPRAGALSGFREFCNLNRVRKSVVAYYTKPRKGHMRAYIILVLACELLNGLPQYGEFEVMFIYCRKRFNWDVETFSYFQTFTTFISAAGMFAMLPLLKWLFLLEDAALGIVGNLGRLTGSVFKVFSSTGLILYLGGSFEVITSVGFVVNRSILSKCVSTDELGKAFAMDGIIQAVLPSFAGVFYTQIYKATLTTFMGAAFIVSIVTTATVCCIYWWIYNDQKKSESDVDRGASDRAD